MENFQVYRDIQARTGGDIYIGVVGPVRTGKSTFIRRFMELVALPEMWCCPYNNAAFVQYAEPQGGETWRLLRDTARACGVWLVAGSVPERDGDAIYNTCYVFDPQGTQQAKHRKVHLFDAGPHRESGRMSAGDVIFRPIDTPFGKLGIAICYDLRFPELARRQAIEGAEILVYPAAWVDGAGKKRQWETLLAARAIENELFVVGVCRADDGYIGSSLVAAPDGSLLVEGSGDEGLYTCELDTESLEPLRENMPIFGHRRPDIY